MMALTWRGRDPGPGRDLVEITDLLWQPDGHGGSRPALAAEITASLLNRGQHRAARIVAQMPSSHGTIDADYLRSLTLSVHCELLRLSEELQFGRRVHAQLAPILTHLRATSGDAIRIVDLGCGLGYVLRFLATGPGLGPGVQLVGVDMNSALIEQARALARQEGPACEFICDDAMHPQAAIQEAARTIVISSGLMHHIPERSLPDFFAGQARLGVAAFAHWDIAPCLWSTLGAWIFHQARMRESVSRHDGVMSARRAHPAATLDAAAQAGAPGYNPQVLEGSRWHPRSLDVLRPIVGRRQ
jgi:SAM-dependent methyltransferase